MAAAKRLVFGQVGIDMIAGPSEVLILADKTGNADWIAADLLAQAEHDASAQSILITDDAALAGEVEKAVAAQLKTLPRETTAAASWRDFGAIIIVPRLDDAIPLVDRLAPEHLEIHAADAEKLERRYPQRRRDLHRSAHAGSDRRLRRGLQPRAADRAFGALSSGLGVLDFMKRTSILNLGPEQLRALGPAAIALGEAEGLTAHARSVAMRMNRK